MMKRSTSVLWPNKKALVDCVVGERTFLANIKTEEINLFQSKYFDCKKINKTECSETKENSSDDIQQSICKG